MNEEQLQAIEERANKATSGPYFYRGQCIYSGMVLICVIPTRNNNDADGAFITNARADVPALIAEVRWLRAKLDATPTDAIRAIYDSVPVNNWTRAPLKAIRQWLASLGKQVSL